MLRKRRHKAATVYADVSKNRGKKNFVVAYDAAHSELDYADWSYPKFGNVLTTHMKDAIADARTRPYNVLQTDAHRWCENVKEAREAVHKELNRQQRLHHEEFPYAFHTYEKPILGLNGTEQNA